MFIGHLATDTKLAAHLPFLHQLQDLGHAGHGSGWLKPGILLAATRPCLARNLLELP